jgi:hypothetical protein
LATLLATPPWDLDKEVYRRHPEALVNVALDLLKRRSETEVLLRKVLASPDTHSQTGHLLGVIIGENDAERELERLVNDRSILVEFRGGYLRGLSQRAPDTADEHVQGWLDRQWFGDVVYGVSVLEATPTRARMAVAAAEEAEAAGATLSLQRLAFGSWLVPLDADAATSVIHRLVTEAERDRTFAAVDAAALAFHSYLGANEITANLKELGYRIVVLTEGDLDGPGHDLAYIRNQIVAEIQLDAVARLGFALRSMSRRAFPSSEDVRALREVLPSLGEGAIESVCQWLLEQDWDISLYLDDASLLSLLSDVFGDGPVARALLAKPTADKAKLLAHLNFKEDLPAVAVAVFDQDSSPAIEQELSRRFLYPGGRFLYPGEVVFGPYSDYLARRLQIVARYAKESASPNTRGWAAKLLPIMDQMIRDERLREEEER